MKNQPMQTVLFIKNDSCEKQLSYLLSNFNCFNISIQIKDSFQAIEYLNNHKVEVLFIESEELEILSSIQKPPFIIAICASSSLKRVKKYLFDGINDFLFLPITEKNIRANISKILNINNSYMKNFNDLQSAAEDVADYNTTKQLSKSVFTSEFMFFNGGRKTESIRILFNEVLFIRSNGNQLEIHGENGETTVIRGSLTKIYAKLPKDKFQKINKSIIVNCDKVTKIIKQNKIVVGNECFSITRSFIKSFKSLLSLR